MRNLLLLLVISLISSCQSDKNAVDISEISQSAQFKRFDQAFFTSDTVNFSESIEKLSENYPEFFSGGKNLRFWKAQRKDPLQLELYNKAQELFGDTARLNDNLNVAAKYFYAYYPEAPEITFYTYISNLDFDFPIIYADSVCFAALDMYLGPQQAYYQQLPEYIAFFRQPAFLVRDIMYELHTQQLAPRTGGTSLLEDMVYFGKLLYAVQATMPSAPENVVIRYTPAHLNFCQKNERSMWTYFIENNFLFDTNQDLKNRFIELAPFSKFRMKFDRETPGMVGHWLGLQIVKAYAANNPDSSLREIMQEKDARKILKLSGYKP